MLRRCRKINEVCCLKVTVALVCCFLLACTTDSYEKGEGKYSLLQADFAELSVNANKQGVSFITDEGAIYELVPSFTAKWIETADTTYRTIVYYDKTTATTARAEAVGTVVTLSPVQHWRFKELPQDAIDLESAWIAKNGKYLNLGLLVKTGRISDEELPHNIGLAQDTLYVHHDGRRTACWRLLHNQNGIPQYYTNRRYVSIRIPTNVPDTIRLTIPTSEGPLQRDFTF